jgi:hypothetical protein
MAISRDFVTAGNATFTVELPAPRDGRSHYTFKVEKVEASDRWPEAYFVKLLVGADNENDFAYLGKLDPHTSETRTTGRSCRPADAFEVRLLNRIMARVWGDDHAAYEQHGYRTHHEGRCGRCGRKLTVPASVESGIGPECARLMTV